MKIIQIAACFALLVCLVCFACSDGMDSGTFHNRTDQHTYSDGDSAGSNLNQPPSRNETKNLEPHSEIRGIWQKPNVVIKKLGELEGKVVADIGAGPYGYFTLRIAHQTPAKKVLALDIDQEAIDFIESAKILLAEDIRNRIESRLVLPDDPKLKPKEADVVLIVNTYGYIDNPLEYLKNLKKGMADNGKIVIIDFKKKRTPVGPPVVNRVALGKVEQDLLKAGYRLIDTDDQTLDYQYIVTAFANLPE